MSRSKAKTHSKKRTPRKQSWSLRRKLTVGIGGVIAALVLWQGVAALSFWVAPMSPTYTFGTSFSKRQSEAFGLNWKENFSALLDDLEIRSFRLMSYWDEIEATRGKLNFSDLDWQMDEAAKRGAKVSLAIGLRQPRWPECHEPKWAVKLDKDAWRKALYGYLEQVVNRYENHPALENFQLENESLTWWFGDCREQPDLQRIREEFALVKSWTDVPIWMSLSDQYGLPLRAPTADGQGFSLYTRVHNSFLPGTYAEPSPPIWYHQARALALKVLFNKTLFVHELQLEPWGPRPIRELSIEEQNHTMNPERIDYNLTFARKVGFDHIYTWGSEWWYWRLSQGDDSIWKSVKAAVHDSRH